MQEDSLFISEKPQETPKNQPKPETAKAFVLSLVALFLVLIFSLWMFGMKMINESKISSLQEQIQTTKTELTQLKSDKQLAVAMLLNDKSAFTNISLAELVWDLKRAALESKVHFNGFSFQNDTINTNLIATSSTDDPVKIIANMMDRYATNAQQNGFSLEPILSISGNRVQRTTPITFKIVPQKTVSENVSEEKTDTSN